MVSYLQTRVQNVLRAKMKVRILAGWHIVRATKLLVGTSARVQSETSAIGNGDNRHRCHLRKCVKLKLCFHRRLHSADAARANSEVAINLFAFYYCDQIER